MLVEVKVPVLSESVAEATLVAWHKKAGEQVNRSENLIDIETDKVVLELPGSQCRQIDENFKTRWCNGDQRRSDRHDRYGSYRQFRRRHSSGGSDGR
jgi:hypothetical protein